MTNDYRDMCAELASELEDWIDGYLINDPSDVHTDAAYKMIERARALLAQPEPEGPTDEELLRVAAISIEPYESSGIASGEYEPETECAIEVYGSELIAYARAVLAKWGANGQ